MSKTAQVSVPQIVGEHDDEVGFRDLAFGFTSFSKMRMVQRLRRGRNTIGMVDFRQGGSEHSSSASHLLLLGSLNRIYFKLLLL